MPEEPNKSKTPLVILAVVVLCAVVAGWFIFKSKKTPNAAPTAALRLDSLDETNRVATLSDGGSQDPDGPLSSWRIAWGDGQEENLSALPQKARHTYATEGEYTISFWCVDNLGATSSVPAMTNITLDFLQRQKVLEAKREADRLKEREARKQADAKREADRLKQAEARKQAERLEQERQKELAAREAQKPGSNKSWNRSGRLRPSWRGKKLKRLRRPSQRRCSQDCPTIPPREKSSTLHRDSHWATFRFTKKKPKAGGTMAIS
jgi:hypothetical protein